MPRIDWDDSFSVNNSEIDGQHQKWISIHNDLHNTLMNKGENKTSGLESLKAMLDYAKYHFSFEEKYMEKINYPEIVPHHRVHKDFENLLYSMYRDAQGNEFFLDSEIIAILKNWLLDHILNEDQKYSRFLQSKE